MQENEVQQTKNLDETVINPSQSPRFHRIQMFSTVLCSHRYPAMHACVYKVHDAHVVFSWGD